MAKAAVAVIVAEEEPAEVTVVVTAAEEEPAEVTVVKAAVAEVTVVEAAAAEAAVPNQTLRNPIDSRPLVSVCQTDYRTGSKTMIVMATDRS